MVHQMVNNNVWYVMFGVISVLSIIRWHLTLDMIRNVALLKEYFEIKSIL